MNVVFDLGGVLLSWQPNGIIEQVGEDPAARAALTAGLFQHPDWLELDRGTLSYEAACSRAAERTGLAASRFHAALALVPDSLIVQHEVLELVRETHRRGHRLFVLSNMHTPVARALEQRHDFWDLFSGIVFSCDVAAIKPEPAIYRHLLENWSLEAQHTVFLDDNRPNVTGAIALGIDAIHFADVRQARSELAQRQIVA